MNRRITSLLTRIVCAASLCIASLTIYGQGNPSKNPDKFASLVSNIAANLDQCANDGVGDTPIVCTGTAWQNGNLSKNAAHYLEGESVPYRLKFTGLVPGQSYTVKIEWDTTENSGAKHAIDYLTDFDESEIGADPCSDIPGCSLADKTTYAIPMDAHVAMGHDQIMGTGDDIIQKPGVFTFFGGTIQGVSSYVMAGTYAGASQTCITLTLIPDVADPVLAWGGHISTRMDWGLNNSAIAIDGSPYHMRLLDLNGTGGNQDRSLSSEATIFPASVVIAKDATPDTGQIFGFVATGPDVSNFSLIDNGTGIGNTQAFAGLTQFGPTNNITVTENQPTTNYLLTNIICVELANGGSGTQNSTVDIANRLANIILEEGEAVTCTFYNNAVTAAGVSVSGRVYDVTGAPIKATVTLTDASTGATVQSLTNPLGYYAFDDVEVNSVYVLRVSGKGYRFTPDSMTIMVADEITNMDFLGERSLSLSTFR